MKKPGRKTGFLNGGAVRNAVFLLIYARHAAHQIMQFKLNAVTRF